MSNKSVPALTRTYADRITQSWGRSKEAIIETGRTLLEAKANLPHGSFTDMIAKELPFLTIRTAQRLMEIARDERLLKNDILSLLPKKTTIIENLTKLEDEGTINREMKGSYVPRHSNSLSVRDPREPGTPLAPPSGAARYPDYVSLEEWVALDEATKAELLSPDRSRVSATHFNKQESAAIEWAQWSWNPITGCLHDCPYCYARDIALGRAKSVYPNGFSPTLKPRLLLAPRNMKVPKEAASDTRYRNVFTGSMADIFGRWVPAEWIEAVLREIRAAPEWNFLCLTKFPKRMAEFDIPPNAWMGTTVDLQARVANAEAAFAEIECGVKWLSCEPLIEPLRFKHLHRFNWIVIGGASRSSKTPEWRPKFEWVMDLVLQARDAGLKVYMKTNLLSRVTELPYDAPLIGDHHKVPDEFYYLGQRD